MPLGARGIRYTVQTAVLTPGTAVECGVTGKTYLVPHLPEPGVGKTETIRCPHCQCALYTAWNNGGDSWGGTWHSGCQVSGGTGFDS